MLLLKLPAVWSVHIRAADHALAAACNRPATSGVSEAAARGSAAAAGARRHAVQRRVMYARITRVHSENSQSTDGKKNLPVSRRLSGCHLLSQTRTALSSRLREDRGSVQ